MLERATIQSLNSSGEERQATLPERNKSLLGRRGFLKLAALSLGGLAVSSALARVATAQERALFIYNPNTGETIRAVYWTPVDGYLHESLREISWALRDYYTDQMKIYDPRLLDQLYVLQLIMEYNTQPFHVISGYRSPSTNAMLRMRSRAVAKDSFHMYGMATDIRMPGRSTGDLRRAALSLGAGGVGYYPRSNFVHVDSGPIRTWSY
jgi:uncharacterized protein YcbK (DUF882 family)